MGPANSAPKPTTDPTAMPAVIPFSFAPVDTRALQERDRKRSPRGLQRHGPHDELCDARRKRGRAGRGDLGTACAHITRLAHSVRRKGPALSFHRAPRGAARLGERHDQEPLSDDAALADLTPQARTTSLERPVVTSRS
jgi:hypothetical protein